MAEGTRLFKLASQINLGKDTIVAFLQSKGFDIENKATARLTPEMTDMVLSQFKKELQSVSKQPSTQSGKSGKTSQEQDSASADRDDSPEPVEPVHHKAPATEQLPTEIAPPPPQQEIPRPAAKAPKEDAPAPAQRPESTTEVASQPAEAAADADTASAKAEVGSVIDLSSFQKRKGNAPTKKAKEPAEQATSAPVAAAQPAAPAPVAAQAAPPQPPAQQTAPAPQPAQQQRPTDRPPFPPRQGERDSRGQQGARQGGYQRSGQRSDDQQRGGNIDSRNVGAPRRDDRPYGQQRDGQPREGQQRDGSPYNRGGQGGGSQQGQQNRRPPQQGQGPRPPYQQGQGPQRQDDRGDRRPQSDDDRRRQGPQKEYRPHQGGAPHAPRVPIPERPVAADDDNDPNKRRKKKKVAEVEYQTGDSIQLPGLTILGKIDLASRSGKPKGKNEVRKDDKRGGKSFSSSEEEARKKKALPAKGTGGPAAPKVGTALIDDDRNKAKANSSKKKKKGKVKVSSADVEQAIRRTLSSMDESVLQQRSRIRQRRKSERAEEQQRILDEMNSEGLTIHVTEFVSVAELASMLDVQANDIILNCMKLGLMVSINQRLDKDTITLIADDYGVKVVFEEEYASENIEEDEDDATKMQPRPPIVTIMGHVDHGKTSLLDYIRSANVVAGESGGITQHIGAYSVSLDSGKIITFLDTPGHQAFTAMRARGAQVTDIVVLVVAADDSVMPQTIEAISHARAANVPIIVALNKIDKADANPDRIRQQLADHGVLVEEWGGKNQCIEISAKNGLNVDALLDKILVEAELLELKADPDRMPRGTVIESKIDKGKGPVATILVQKGTLSVGQPFICGLIAGRVRAMFDERGHRVEKAGPSTAVQIIGLDGTPQAGDIFIAMDSESESKGIAIKRQAIRREQEFKQRRHLTLDELSKQIKAGGVQQLPIVLKADTDGSVEALTDSLQKLSHEEVQVLVIHRGVGAISESDIMLAAASNAIVIGFHVRPTPQAKKLAEAEQIDVRIYRIIYDCINEVKAALEGMLNPEFKEEVSGMAEVREVFKISKIGTVAGCYMQEGKIFRNDTIRLVRDGFEIFQGSISALKRFKDDVREVSSGYECGISIHNFNDIKVGDIIEAVKTIEIKRTLS